jgi:hypothetical protein
MNEIVYTKEANKLFKENIGEEQDVRTEDTPKTVNEKKVEKAKAYNYDIIPKFGEKE